MLYRIVLRWQLDKSFDIVFEFVRLVDSVVYTAVPLLSTVSYVIFRGAVSTTCSCAFPLVPGRLLIFVLLITGA